MNNNSNNNQISNNIAMKSYKPFIAIKTFVSNSPIAKEQNADDGQDNECI